MGGARGQEKSFSIFISKLFGFVTRPPFAVGRGKILLVFISFIISFLFYTNNIYGIQTYSNKISSDALNVLLAQFYSQQTAPNIIVVVADEGDLQANNEPIPPGFDFHRQVVDAIDFLGASLILVDFVFDRPHAGDQGPLRRFASTLGEVRSELFFAAVRSSEASPKGVMGPIATQVSVVSVPKFLNYSSDNLYCDSFGLNKGSDVIDINLECDAGSNIKIPTMAFAAYKYYCKNFQSDGCAPDVESIPDRPIRVFWGAQPSTLFQYLRGAGECRSIGFLESLDPGQRIYANRCPHHPVLHVQELRCLASIAARKGIVFDAVEMPGGDSSKGSFCDDVHLTGPRQMAIEAFKGAIVLYGGQFGANPDVIRPPTVPGVAGVHLHAMALDNLFHWQGHAKSDSSSVMGFEIDASTINAIFFIALFAIASILSQSRACSTKSKSRIIYSSKSFEVALVSILFVSFAWFSFSVLSISAINWIGAWFTAIVLPETIQSIVVKTWAFARDLNSRIRSIIS